MEVLSIILSQILRVPPILVNIIIVNFFHIGWTKYWLRHALFILDILMCPVFHLENWYIGGYLKFTRFDKKKGPVM